MKIGISTASLFLKANTEDAISAIRQMGADTVGIFLSTYTEYGEDYARLFASAAGDLPVHSVHALTTQFEPQLFSANERVYADALYVLRRVCRAAQITGARYYTFHGPLHLKRSPLNIDLENFATRLNELTVIAAEYGVTVCYENIHYGFYSQPDFFPPLAARCPKLGMCLDIKHAAYSEYAVEKYIEAGGDRIKTVHVVDMDEDGNTALPGCGKTDFKRIINALNVGGVDAPLLIEAYAKNYTEKAQLKRSLDYLKNLI